MYEGLLKERCSWPKGDDTYLEYHDLEWGAPNGFAAMFLRAVARIKKKTARHFFRHS
jgi:3-methyladenine DNA glycosylase Tag